MRASRLAAVLGTLAVAAILPASLAGQSVTYHSTTHFHMGGALGSFMASMGGGHDAGVTTYVDAHHMRTDSRDQSTIVDLDAGRIYSIDRQKKTYTSMTFEQMADMMRQMQARMSEEQAKQHGQARPTSRGQSAPDLQWDYTVSARNTGKHQAIAGYDAQEQLITLTATARDQTQPDSVSLVVLMDLWSSPDAPTATVTQEFQRAYAARARTTFEQPARNMGAMLAISPDLKAALAAAGKELAKVHGAHLRTTTYIVGVPEGMKFDPDLTLGGSAAASAQSSAQSASAPPAKKGLGGFFSKMKAAAGAAEQQQSQNSQTASKPEQATLLWFSDEVDQIRTGVPADAFSIPAGYSEVKSDVSRMH